MRQQPVSRTSWLGTPSLDANRLLLIHKKTNKTAARDSPNAAMNPADLPMSCFADSAVHANTDQSRRTPTNQPTDSPTDRKTTTQTDEQTNTGGGGVTIVGHQNNNKEYFQAKRTTSQPATGNQDRAYTGTYCTYCSIVQ